MDRQPPAAIHPRDRHVPDRAPARTDGALWATSGRFGASGGPLLSPAGANSTSAVVGSRAIRYKGGYSGRQRVANMPVITEGTTIMGTGSRLPRRKWLLRALTGTISVTVAAIAYPILAFLRPRRTGPVLGVEVVAPYRVNQLVADAEGKWPEPFDFGGRPCLVVKTAEGEIKAFNAVCTHLDCTVTFRPQQHDIFCNCHNGVFDEDGRNVAGPPPRPLQEYQVDLRGAPGQEDIIVSRG